MSSLPVLSADGERRQARLMDARLLVVCDTRGGAGDLEAVLVGCCEGSADVLLLRDKTATEEALRAAAIVFRDVADRYGALFLVNDLPGLAASVGADGVHVGQHDVHPDHARRVMGADLLVGRSVGTREEIDRAGDEDVDYLVVGPGSVPTFAECHGASDVELLRHATRHASHPWFAAAGHDVVTGVTALAGGARRLVVGASVTGASDPATATWAVRRLLATRHE